MKSNISVDDGSFLSGVKLLHCTDVFNNSPVYRAAGDENKKTKTVEHLVKRSFVINVTTV